MYLQYNKGSLKFRDLSYFKFFEALHHKVLTYVEYRAVPRVFQTIEPPPPSPPNECVLTPHQGRGVHTRRAVKGVGGSIFWKTSDIGLVSYSMDLSTHYTVQLVVGVSLGLGVLNEPYSAKPAQRSSPTGPPG